MFSQFDPSYKNVRPQLVFTVKSWSCLSYSTFLVVYFMYLFVIIFCVKSYQILLKPVVKLSIKIVLMLVYVVILKIQK